MTIDIWTAPNTKGSYLDMTAHWIEVTGVEKVKEKCQLESEVVAFFYTALTKTVLISFN